MIKDESYMYKMIRAVLLLLLCIMMTARYDGRDMQTEEMEGNHIYCFEEGSRIFIGGKNDFLIYVDADSYGSVSSISYQVEMCGDEKEVTMIRIVRK